MSSYPQDSLREAFQIAFDYLTFLCSFIKDVLEKLGQFREDPLPQISTLGYLPSVDIQRSLRVYEQLIPRR